MPAVLPGPLHDEQQVGPVVATLLPACIEGLGRAAFVRGLLHVCAALAGATDCSLFVAGAQRAPRLVGAASLAGRAAEDAGERYLCGRYFRYDSNLRLAGAVGAAIVVNQQRKDDVPDAHYRTDCYELAGLEERISLLVPLQTHGWAFVNAYRRPGCDTSTDTAVQALRGNRCWLAALVRRHVELMVQDAPPMPDPLAALSSREREVAEGLLEGLTAKEIARRLALSPTSVATYRQRAFDKLGVRRLVELVRLWRKPGGD